jgi:hypothetical protein
MVGQAALNRSIGVRLPVSQPSGDAERAEIYHLVRDAKITGFVSGDRHSFWAGYATRVAAHPFAAEDVGSRRRRLTIDLTESRRVRLY